MDKKTQIVWLLDSQNTPAKFARSILLFFKSIKSKHLKSLKNESGLFNIMHHLPVPNPICQRPSITTKETHFP